ncbi:hypothetical protein HDV05_004955 [Chytridiales sp. JEL 0842]|nr:hypothetical protein HDV05_004955 [Chytridiales sp. JEL 0842]
MDRLTAELQQLLATADPPPLEPALNRLFVARKRLISVNSSLKTSLDRLERVHALVCKSQGGGTPVSTFGSAFTGSGEGGSLGMSVGRGLASFFSGSGK